MKNAVWYRNQWLAKGSKALELYEKGEIDKLDKHLKEVEVNDRKLTGMKTK